MIAANAVIRPGSVWYQCGCFGFFWLMGRPPGLSHLA
jgi:hypothetical protein